MGKPAEDRDYLLRQLSKLDQQMAVVSDLLADFKRRQDKHRIACAERMLELLTTDREMIDFTIMRAKECGGWPKFGEGKG